MIRAFKGFGTCRQGDSEHSNELLILAESFYLEDRKEEVKAELWYREGPAMLNEVERAYLDYDNIFGNRRPDGRWEKDGTEFYRRLEAALIEAGFPRACPLDHCTLANCFTRPAINGQSLRLSRQDTDAAKAFVIELVEHLQPRLLICASSKAYNAVVGCLQLKCKVAKVCHPASIWWYRDGGKHGRRKFIEAVKGTVLSAKQA